MNRIEANNQIQEAANTIKSIGKLLDAAKVHHFIDYKNMIVRNGEVMTEILIPKRSHTEKARKLIDSLGFEITETQNNTHQNIYYKFKFEIIIKS